MLVILAVLVALPLLAACSDDVIVTPPNPTKQVIVPDAAPRGDVKALVIVTPPSPTKQVIVPDAAPRGDVKALVK